LAADLKQRFDLDAILKPGHGGIFDVEVDGKMIYSKHETERFPNPGEVDGLIAAMKKPKT
jgi:selT/selW/selH-like putative selenoprotein